MIAVHLHIDYDLSTRMSRCNPRNPLANRRLCERQLRCNLSPHVVFHNNPVEDCFGKWRHPSGHLVPCNKCRIGCVNYYAKVKASIAHELPQHSPCLLHGQLPTKMLHKRPHIQPCHSLHVNTLSPMPCLDPTAVMNLPPRLSTFLPSCSASFPPTKSNTKSTLDSCSCVPKDPTL